MGKYIVFLLVLIVLIAGAIFVMKEQDAQVIEYSERPVLLFYYAPANDLDADNNIQCSSAGLVAVQANIPADSQNPIEETIRLLLGGFVPANQDMLGVEKGFPLDGVELTSAQLRGGALAITIADPLNKTGGGSCRVSILRAQIEATAKQFDEVKKVVILPEELFQP